MQNKNALSKIGIVLVSCVLSFALAFAEEQGEKETSSENKSSPFTGIYGNRTKEKREKIARRTFGSLDSEKSVEKALVWLAKNQNEDGSWGNENSKVLTDFAIHAFLGHGETTESELYGENIKRALDWKTSNHSIVNPFASADIYFLCNHLPMKENIKNDIKWVIDNDSIFHSHINPRTEKKITYSAASFYNYESKRMLRVPIMVRHDKTCIDGLEEYTKKIVSCMVQRHLSKKGGFSGREDDKSNKYVGKYVDKYVDMNATFFCLLFLSLASDDKTPGIAKSYDYLVSEIIPLAKKKNTAKWGWLNPPFEKNIYVSWFYVGLTFTSGLGLEHKYTKQWNNSLITNIRPKQNTDGSWDFQGKKEMKDGYYTDFCLDPTLYPQKLDEKEGKIYTTALFTLMLETPYLYDFTK